MRVMNKVLKIAHLKSHLGLNIPIKLNETLTDSCMVFFRRLKCLTAKLILASDG